MNIKWFCLCIWCCIGLLFVFILFLQCKDKWYLRQIGEVFVYIINKKLYIGTTLGQMKNILIKQIMDNESVKLDFKDIEME